MLFQVMKNDYAVLVCAHYCLGSQWLQTELVFCITQCAVVVLFVECHITMGGAATFVL